jgi:predicted DNA-binding transcriptional regulator AlpA
MGEWWVYQNAQKKILPSVKLGTRSVRFRPNEIQAWLDARSRRSETAEPEPAGAG